MDLLVESVADGVNLIQIREKSLPARLLGDLVRASRDAIDKSSARIVVNDRIDVAIASGTAGVHLGQHSLAPATVRENFERDLLIGVSTHSLSEAISAVEGHANYIFLGPVFETPGKGAPLGVDELAEICEAVRPFPVLALGGIDETNVERAVEAGVAGVAAIRSMYNSASRRKICKLLKRRDTY